jgi:hypothetical protein
MSAKLTPWFPPDVKPNRVGIYERRALNGRILPFPFYYFNGVNWTICCGSAPDKVDATATEQLSKYEFMWRGLARKPRSAP